METKTTFSIHTKLHIHKMRRLLLACVFSALCAGGAYGQEETLQLKFSNAGVQTAIESDYVAVTALAPNRPYRAAVSAYLQGETVTPVATMVTARLQFESSTDREVSGDSDTAELMITSDEAVADDSVIIVITATYQNYQASVEIYYPISALNLSEQTDSDNDGVPDDVDPETSTTRLASDTNGAYLEVSGDDSRIVLGNRARQVQNYQAKLTAESVTELGISEPPGYEGQGRYDFAFFHSQTVYTYVVVPLAATSEEDKDWYVYDDGNWELFTPEDIADVRGGIPGVNENQYYSAEGMLVRVSGEDQLRCPDADPSHPRWTSTGVVEAGHQCVLLAIFDGGPNDGDGEVNGFVTQLGAPGGVPGQETLQLKFSNAGVQTAIESDYVAVTALAPNRPYRVAVSAYLQGETVTPVATMVTARLQFESSADREVSGDSDTAELMITSDEAVADDSVIIVITAMYQNYQASVEIYYPISALNLSEQTDSDNDGVPDDVDPETSTTRLASDTNGAYLEVSGDDSRIVLGNRARQVENDQAKLTEDSVRELGISEPPGYEGQGRYDFAFFHSTEVYTYVVVPLAATSDEDKYWNIYDDGDWKPFKRDNEGDEERITGVADVNEYYSAERTNTDGPVTCPAPDPDAQDDQNARQWTSTGVVEAGHQCVLLAIFDGGPNDGDGEVNGFVTQLGAPGSEIAEDSNGSSGSSSGASDLWLLMLLLAMLALTLLVRRCRFATP